MPGDRESAASTAESRRRRKLPSTDGGGASGGSGAGSVLSTSADGPDRKPTKRSTSRGKRRSGSRKSRKAAAIPPADMGRAYTTAEPQEPSTPPPRRISPPTTAASAHDARLGLPTSPPQSPLSAALAERVAVEKQRRAENREALASDPPGEVIQSHGVTPHLHEAVLNRSDIDGGGSISATSTPRGSPGDRPPRSYSAKQADRHARQLVRQIAAAGARPGVADCRSPSLSPDPLSARSPPPPRSSDYAVGNGEGPLPDPLRRESLLDSGLSLEDLGQISVTPTGVGLVRSRIRRSSSHGSGVGCSTVSCSECGKSDATVHCIDCKQGYCGECSEDVHRRRSYRSHVIHQLAEYRRSWSADMSEPLLSASTSTIQPLRESAASNSGHSSFTGTRARELAREVRKQRDEWKGHVTSIDTLLEILQSDRIALTAEVHDHFKKLHRALNLREAALSREVDIGHAARVMSLEREAERFRIAVVESKRLIRQARALPSDSTEDVTGLVDQLEAVGLTGNSCDVGPLLAKASKSPMTLGVEGFREIVTQLGQYAGIHRDGTE
eukprot:m.151756 g.151756  ORF g.151756 m.151756 type:complete len:556 (+) comp23362_c0_seq1:419-2086(+)